MIFQSLYDAQENPSLKEIHPSLESLHCIVISCIDLRRRNLVGDLVNTITNTHWNMYVKKTYIVNIVTPRKVKPKFLWWDQIHKASLSSTTFVTDPPIASCE